MLLYFPLAERSFHEELDERNEALDVVYTIFNFSQHRTTSSGKQILRT